MFCPALTDGSIGDMIYIHSYKNPGLIVDIAQGIGYMYMYVGQRICSALVQFGCYQYTDMNECEGLHPY